MRLSISSITAQIFAAALIASQANAQKDSADSRPFLSGRDAVVAAGFVAATAAAFPLDERIAHRLENPGTQANRFLGHTATGFEVIAIPGAFVLGGGMYLVGRVAHHERLEDLGLHGTSAIVVADAAGELIKSLAGRSRPFVTADTNAHDFKFGGGLGNDDRTSFPSVHTTTAFAAAAAVTAETGRWWPKSTKIVGPLMYGGATMVALSRMYHNKHWMSDVALGAAIGTFSGQKVIQYTHAHPKNWLDRTLLKTSLFVDGHGRAYAAWSPTF